MLVAAAVEGPPADAPPAVPVVGNCHFVGAAPSGDWSGHAGKLAAFTSGGWRFLAPTDGMCAHVKSNGTTALYRDGAWEMGALRGSQLIIGGLQVVGSRSAAIPAPTGGTTVDLEARTAIGQILAALREHGLVEM